jgi:hypothetical protein
MYPATYLKAADLGNSRISVTISKITLEDVGQGEMKPCLHFLGKDKGMILNKTNGLIIAQSLGDESDNWSGKTIELYAHMVAFQGKMVQGLAVHIAQPNPVGQPPVSQSAGQQPQPMPYQDKLEQDISNMEAATANPDAGLADDIPF